MSADRWSRWVNAHCSLPVTHTYTHMHVQQRLLLPFVSELIVMHYRPPGCQSLCVCVLFVCVRTGERSIITDRNNHYRLSERVSPAIKIGPTHWPNLFPQTTAVHVCFGLCVSWRLCFTCHSPTLSDQLTSLVLMKQTLISEITNCIQLSAWTVFLVDFSIKITAGGFSIIRKKW